MIIYHSAQVAIIDDNGRNGVIKLKFVLDGKVLRININKYYESKSVQTPI